jgi:prolyl oligopeptidase
MCLLRPLRTCFSLWLLTLAAIAQSPSIPKPPDTPKHPAIDEYQGTKVTDDYRWLENWDDPAVKQWSAAENARTREYLDHLPARAAIKHHLSELMAATSASYFNMQFRGGMLFAMKFQPPQQQPMLVAMHSADDPGSANVIFDPNAAGTKGSVSV